ncbi:SCP2 sterol-binding domain-containing protein [Faucicola mancuniensis]|uniref:SCP2 sterol-binding domain-containing protein n=1 Tax=Faucicola mancuniensis TaxID=1309795 RepID=UPI0028E6ACAC|nr:SCP2 sterol-binding domain-containing protein [uncultured Moraxella sp.]
MAKFLSQDWFNQVNDLTAQAGDLNLPPAIKNLSINLNVTDNNETIGASFYDGVIHQGTKDGALTTLNLDTNTLKKVFLERDMNYAMEAFMAGKIRVDGDMGQLMSIQTASPSPEQKQLLKNILAITEI